MPAPSIYLDNNATTRIDPRVAEAMATIQRDRLVNPASQHSDGRKARRVLEEARLTIATCLGCRTKGMAADQILFTSGGTEANNLAIFGLLEGREGDLVVSSIEHPSILGAAESVAKRGKHRVRYLPVGKNGQISIDEWNDVLLGHRLASQGKCAEGRIAMVSLMLANNETGVIQPFQEIVNSARLEGILVHADAVQAIAKIPFSFEKSNLDAMTVTAHKFHGPVGIGSLVLKAAVPLVPIHFGGFQQLGLRPGTESVELAVGFAAAIQLATNDLLERNERMTEFRIQLENLLLENTRSPKIICANEARLPHTISLAYPGIERQALQMALDREGLSCGTGSACASGSGQPSHVLKAMGASNSILRSAIRLSLSAETTSQEIVEAARIITLVVNRFPYPNLFDEP